MSVPLSDGLSLSTYQRWAALRRLAVCRRATTIVPGLTFTTRVPAAACRRSSEKRSAAATSSGPRSTVCVLSLTRYHWPPVGRRRVLGGRLARDLQRLVLGHPGLSRRRAAGDLRVGRVRLAVRPEDVGLPVVEVELGDLADLLQGALGVLDVGQADLDLVGAGALDLGLGDAELVDALADDVHRAVERVLRRPWAAAAWACPGRRARRRP